jgi:hypothetical protein
MTNGQPIAFTRYRDGIVASTENGLYFYNSEWVGERWAFE